MTWISILAKLSSILVYSWFAEFLYFALLQEAGKQFKVRKWVHYLFGNKEKLTPFISTGTYVLFALFSVVFLYFFENITTPITILLIEKLAWQVIFFFLLALSLFVFWTTKFTANVCDLTKSRKQRFSLEMRQPTFQSWKIFAWDLGE